MVIVNGNDFFSVKCGSLIADYDKATLVNLYQPMIGYEATALYLSLYEEAKNQEVLSLSTHEAFFNRMRMNSQTFMDAREKLEAMGLVKTYLERGDICIYHYELYAPLDPERFFKNELLYGCLVNSVGIVESERLKTLYVVSPEETQGDDITTQFQEVFTETGTYLDESQGPKRTLRQRIASHANTSFDRSLFLQKVYELTGGEGVGVTENAFSKKELNRIEDVLTLNGISEEVGAKAVADIFEDSQPKGNRVNIQKLIKQAVIYHHTNTQLYAKKEESTGSTISSETALGERINNCETKTPIEYLSMKQGYTQPADADVSLVSLLSVKYGLPHSVINALIEFSLERCNNSLHFQYCDKVAAALKRENITCAKDAFEYLYNSTKKFQTPRQSTNLNSSNDDEEEITQEEWDALIDKIHGKD